MILVLTDFLTAWGDVDALAEAGFCYAQGVGCKKNLKKSATFYRQAEAKGMSMVGNSWYEQILFRVNTKSRSSRFTGSTSLNTTTTAQAHRSQTRRRAPSQGLGRVCSERRPRRDDEAAYCITTEMPTFPALAEHILTINDHEHTRLII